MIVGFNVWAQAQITTTVSKKKISLNDVLYVTYNYSGSSDLISNENVNFPNFQVVGFGKQVTNFEDYSFTYTLQPTRIGNHKIPGMTVTTSDGKQYTSNTVTVEVVGSTMDRNPQPSQNPPSSNTKINSAWRSKYLNDVKKSIRGADPLMQVRTLAAEIEKIDIAIFMEDYEPEVNRELMNVKRDLVKMMNEIRQNANNNGSQNPNTFSEQFGNTPASESFFIKAIPSKTKAYVGEPIEVVYKVYFIRDFSNGSIQKLPDFKGFNSREFELDEKLKPYRETYNGKAYAVVDIKKTLLFPNQSGRLELDPMSITAFTSLSGRMQIASEPVYIEVSELPTIPDAQYFTGGVGKYGVTTSIDKVKFTTDDFASFYFTIAGKGNYEMVNAPVVNNLPPHVSLGSTTEEVEGQAGNVLFGKKTFKYNLSVDKAGNYEIPAIPFTYFDIDKKDYVTVYSEPITFTVEQGELIVKKQETVSESEQLRDIETGNLPALSSNTIWARSPIFYTLLALALVGIPLWVRRRSDPSSSLLASKKEKNKANKVAFARLVKARALLNQEQGTLFYEEISKSIWLYLSDKLQLPMTDLNKENLGLKLQERNIDEVQINSTIQLIEECEMALYAGMGGQQQKEWALNKATELISNYETQL